MKKNILFSCIVLFVFSLFIVTENACALNYTISFSGSGASTSVDSVIVQNLTKGTTVTVPAGYGLNLMVDLNAVEQVKANDENIHIYPNLIEGTSTLSFLAKQAGVVQINAFSLDGRKYIGVSQNLQEGMNSFQLSFPKGFFAIQVTGNGYSYSGKMINQTGLVGNPKITFFGYEKTKRSIQKSKSSSAISMAYTSGDQLLYKGISGNYSTIVTDVPTASTTTNFNFMECRDAGGNNYKIVTIGTQTWMAENLRTSKYYDGTNCGGLWYDNDSIYNKIYGKLYSGCDVATGKLAPDGWHVSTSGEWDILMTYVGSKLGQDMNSSGVEKALASTTNWTNTIINTNMNQNNSSGFSALPGGRIKGGIFTDICYAAYWLLAGETSCNNPNMMFEGYIYLPKLIFQSNSDFYPAIRSVRCVRNTIVALSLTTTSQSNVTTNSATIGGNVTCSGGAAITARGVCWNTSTNPTIDNSKTSDGTGITGLGAFTSSLTGLAENTTYYVRAYAINNTGTVAYGDQIAFKTRQIVPEIVKDIDGNEYLTVNIGNLTWMVENLKTTRYNDGTAIPLVTDNVAWNALTTPGYCWYNNDSISYKNTYGALYNWYAVNTAKLAPAGWHVATQAEWLQLVGSGNSLKEAGNSHWSTGGTNLTGFTALPGGFRSSTGFSGGYAAWWSSTKYDMNFAWYIFMTSNAPYVDVYNKETTVYINNKVTTVTKGLSGGMSVRCVKGDPFLVTEEATVITGTTATCGGLIADSIGGAAVIERGVCWNTSGDPTVANDKKTNGSGSGAFSCSIAGLSIGTTYYVRAYATKSYGTVYGNELKFTTSNYPKVITITIAKADNTVTCQGNVTDSCGAAITARGFCWSTNPNPTIADNKTTDGVGIGIYSSSINLLSAKTFNIRAYATNANGTAYGANVQINTSWNLPVLATVPITSIAQTSATSGGSVSSNGGVNLTACGVCWSTNPNPTIADNKTIDDVGISFFTSNIRGLAPNTIYYVRAYAINIIGISYGDECQFKTLPLLEGTVADVDGNIYHTIVMGTQTWMVENLKATKFRDGSSIRNVTENNDIWGSMNTPAICDYGNDAKNSVVYGKLYNGYVVTDSRNIAPVGWHVPTDVEWTTLENYLNANNLSIKNSSGFNALYGGMRSCKGGFDSLNYEGYWWSSTITVSNLWLREIYWANNIIRSYGLMCGGYSVRCIKD
jgi:uncharacterized protein (TIGR02145 family)